MDERNVRITSPNGDLATTSFGPFGPDHRSPSSRPMSWVKRQITLQLDGSDVESYLQADADFDNQTMHALPAGCFIVSAVAYSETGASVSLSAFDVNGLGSDGNLGTVAPAAKGWAALRDIDAITSARTQIGFTIGAAETATVQIEYVQAVAEGAEDGVLAKAR